MRKIIFINRFFYPDHSATSQLLSDLAFNLKSNQVETHIITSRQRYDKPKSLLPSEEIIQGVYVHRVWTTRFGRYNNYGRVIDYLSFYLTSLLCLLRLTQKNDILVAKTDPPLISVPAAIVAKLRSAILVNWVQDIFPEVAQKLNVRYIRGPLYFMLKRLRNMGLRTARQNVVIGKKMAEHLRNQGISDNKITIIDNWMDNKQVKPVVPEKNRLRKEWGLADKCVIGYSGNLGRAHEFATILDAAEMLMDEPDIAFVFIGGGVRIDSARTECRRRGLSNVLFKPYQPKERLSESLSVPDIHLISLNPALEGLIVPSKFYGVLSVGRPIVFIGDKNGEIAHKLKKHRCGLAVEEGDAASLCAVIRRFSKDSDFGVQMAKNSQEISEGIYSAEMAMNKWRSVFHWQLGVELYDDVFRGIRYTNHNS